MAFNAQDHLIQLGGKDYLEVKWRLVWLREDKPEWGVLTELLQLDLYAIVKATITDETGRVIASGHGMAKTGGGAKWAGREIEKAETAAIGRALAHAGFGTQFIDDETEGEGDHLADSPVDRKQQKPQNQPNTQQRQTTPAPSSVAFDDTSGSAFIEWAGTQFDRSPVQLIQALKRQVPALETVQQWPFSVNEAIAAIMAHMCDYNDTDLKNWIVNLKKVKVLKNSRGEYFNDAQLDTFKTLALKLTQP